jgi:hypothetical protein
VSHYGQQPLESAIRNLELFAEHILPALNELTENQSDEQSDQQRVA